MAHPHCASTQGCYAAAMFMRHIASFMILLGGLSCLMPVAAHAQSVSNVTITRENQSSTRFILDINKEVPYRAFVLNNPMRLVIDLPKMNWNAPLNKGDRNGFIKSYRKGIYQNDTLRVVLELNKPVTIATHAKLAPASGSNWRYAFELQPVNAIQFQQSLNKVITGGGATTAATHNTTPMQKPAIQNSVPASPQQPIPVAPSKPTLVASTAHKKPLIVVDAGHGGVDPGALATNGMYEKNITLATAKEVKRILEATGKYRVHLTRDKDIFIKLPERVQIARRLSADMFISLHADTIARPQVHGSSVYTLSDVASDAETAKLAARENAVDTLVNVDVGHVDADVADILIDLVTRDNMNQSKILAETVVSTFHSTGIGTLPQRPHRSAGFAVLKAPDIPSVLIEMGFLSNKQEADMLANASYRTKLASSVAKVIERYYSETSKMAAY
jgi:N-acetylmuramoyl-L-alanine amidase